MWRRSWSFILLKQTSVSWGVRYKPKPPLGLRLVAAFSSQVSSSGGGGGGGESITFEEAKKLMRLVNVEELKMKLGTMQGKEVIGYSVLLRACHSMGVSKSEDEAATFARVLDQAGVVLLFRDKVYLHPDKIQNWGESISMKTYFLFTSRDPTYEDLLKRLFLSRRRKLIKKHDFDAERFMELQRKCKCPLDSPGFVKQRIGVEIEHEDAFH